MPRPTTASSPTSSGGWTRRRWPRRSPAQASIHRLNRTEYGNAVRDLLALEVDAAEFLPADDEGYGFDNIADVLRVSPSLLEQYLVGVGQDRGARRRRPRHAGRDGRVSRAAGDLAQAAHVEGLPLGTRGGVKIRHNFPLDAEYEFDVFLLRNIVGYMTGLEWAHELEIAVDGERVFLAQVGGEADNALSDANMSAAANEIDARLRTRTFVTAGPHDVTVAFLERSAAETHEPLELHTRNLDLQDMNGLPVVDYVNVRGPFNAVGPGNTPSRERIFTCRPADDVDGARLRRAKFFRRSRAALIAASRRSRTSRRCSAFYEAGAARGGFDAGIESALRVILTSPKFLFRDEPDPAGAAPGSLYALDDSALASRLAFFLWSAPPDDELLDARRARQAQRRARLRRSRSTRMLADPRSSALVENFAGQWLFLRNLQSARPDVEEFPELRRQPAAGDAARDRAVVRARHARGPQRHRAADGRLHVRQRAARAALRHRRASTAATSARCRSTDEARRGLLGHASILTVTSYPNRTSPVLRGKWVLENVLGTPPPPPLPRRAGARGERGRQGRAHAARAARGASREPRVRDLSRRHGPDRARRSRTSTPSASGARASRAATSTRTGSSRTARRSTARRSCAKR